MDELPAEGIIGANPFCCVDERGKIKRNGKKWAFTLLELMTVLAIIGILTTLAVQAYSALVYRAQRVTCTSNLKNLFAATSSYLNDYQSWPQVSTANIGGTSYAQSWITALTPYKLTIVNWVCPSVQRLLNNPDLTLSQNVRVDYYATPFDTNPSSPMRYSTQPWFIECANVHGDGNLLILTSGAVESLNQALANGSTAPPQ
jgi:prepilin-type N-terminal cleavage/methylation domain-containing protein